MLAITGALLVSVAMLVDLKPVVDQNFFFSTNDPGIQQTNKIERRFPSQPEVILAVASRDISSPRYLERIQKLTQRAHTIGGVSAVKSLTEGPKSFEDALKSPFWSRLLIAHDRKSTNVIIFMKGRHTEKPIQRLEQIVHELDARDFRIHIAGPPYVVEMLRRSLAHDFRYFSLTAVALFGLTMAGLFRSVRLFLGMLCTCTSAVLLALLLQSLLGHKIGVLTVNLGTIVFVIALSHLVYMTFNWQTLADRAHRMGKESPNLAAEARRMTFPPSFWSMVCASLGFASLLIVQAKPLRELGFDVSGVSALGGPAQKQNCGGRTYPRILVAPLCVALVRRHFAQRRLGIWPYRGEHRSEPSRLFQTKSGIARWVEIRRSHGRLQPAHAGGVCIKRKQTEHRRCLQEDVDVARCAGESETGRDGDFAANSSG
jgi:predicted RND superfamily exporter protein